MVASDTSMLVKSNAGSAGKPRRDKSQSTIKVIGPDIVKRSATKVTIEASYPNYGRITEIKDTLQKCGACKVVISGHTLTVRCTNELINTVMDIMSAPR